MEPDDLAKEIARRKQAAKDLKLRELVWKLYSSYLQNHSRNIAREPGSILPALKDTLTINDNRYSFHIGDAVYEIIYTQGKEQTDGSRRLEDQVSKTPMQLSLECGCKLVFEFKMTKTIRYGEDGPLFSEQLGEITAFIEGPWVTQFNAFVQKADQFRRQYSDERNAERLARKAQAERKRFGL
jgi:hypothetical protein